jgi:maltokinase
VSERASALIGPEGHVSLLVGLAPSGLLELVAGRRWFAATGHEAIGASLAALVHADDELELGLVEVAFADGGSALYLVALGAGGEDALGDPAALRRLLALNGVESPCADARPAGLDQTNSAVIVDDAYVLKLYRHIEDGPAVEAQLLDALERAGFDSAPRLRGRLDHAGATLAIVTDYVPALGDGWELTAASLVAGDAGWLPDRARRLGEVTGAMHTALAAVAEPALAAAAPEVGAIDALASELDGELLQLEDSPLGGRVDDLRRLVRELAAAAEAPELATRIHGDYHLAQVLWATALRGVTPPRVRKERLTRFGATPDCDWVVIDLEGEPTRTLEERRRRAFALRDVAGMTRSFAYAANASRLLGGVAPPEGWEESCRSAFLAGWRSTVDERLVPSTEAGAAGLLALFELQKLLYELRYELAHRPDWVVVPLAGLEQIGERR